MLRKGNGNGKRKGKSCLKSRGCGSGLMDDLIRRACSSECRGARLDELIEISFRYTNGPPHFAYFTVVAAWSNLHLAHASRSALESTQPASTLLHSHGVSRPAIETVELINRSNGHAAHLVTDDVAAGGSSAEAAGAERLPFWASFQRDRPPVVSVVDRYEGSG